MCRKPKIVACIEARMGSNRLPGKVLMDIGGKPALQILTERLLRSKYIDEIIIATTVSPADEKIEEFGKRSGISVYRGSEEDVLGRVVEAVESVNGEIIVEITGDCPLMDPAVVDIVLDEFFSNYPVYDYVTNIGYVKDEKREIPLGMDVRVFNYKDLKYISGITKDPEDREHVSLYFFRTGKDKYKLFNVKTPEKWKRDYNPRLCLDTKEDLEVIRKIYDSLIREKKDFDLVDILNFTDNNRDIVRINSEVKQKTVSNLEQI